MKRALGYSVVAILLAGSTGPLAQEYPVDPGYRQDRRELTPLERRERGGVIIQDETGRIIEPREPRPDMDEGDDDDDDDDD